MSDKKKETEAGAMDDDAIKRSREAREAQKKRIKEAMDVDSTPEDANTAAWNRGRNAADPSRKKNTKVKTT